MPSSRLLILTVLAAITISTAAMAQDAAIVVDPAIAAMSVQDKVTARQQAMKEDGKLLRGAAQATGDEAVGIATTVLKNFTNFPALFPEGTDTSTSEASSDVWKEFDQFTALFAKGQADAQAMLTAAKSGDAATYGASLNALKQVCGECHQRYRID